MNALKISHATKLLRLMVLWTAAAVLLVTFSAAGHAASPATEACFLFADGNPLADETLNGGPGQDRGTAGGNESPLVEKKAPEGGLCISYIKSVNRH